MTHIGDWLYDCWRLGGGGVEGLAAFLLLLTVLVPATKTRSASVFGGGGGGGDGARTISGTGTSSVTGTGGSPFRPCTDIVANGTGAVGNFFGIRYVRKGCFFRVPSSLFKQSVLVIGHVMGTPISGRGHGTNCPNSRVDSRIVHFRLKQSGGLFVHRVSCLRRSASALKVCRTILGSGIRPVITAFPLGAVHGSDLAGGCIVRVASFVHESGSVFSFSGCTGSGVKTASVVSSTDCVSALGTFPRGVRVHAIHAFRQGPPVNDTLRGVVTRCCGSANPVACRLGDSVLLLPGRPVGPQLCSPHMNCFTINCGSFSNGPRNVGCGTGVAH